MTKQKQSSWEERFYKDFGYLIRRRTDVLQYLPESTLEQIKQFIQEELTKQKEEWVDELKQKFVDIAIDTGAKTPDELKGLTLYTYFLEYLDSLKTETKEEK